MKRDRIDLVSAVCWDGNHRRCPGWMVVPDHSRIGLYYHSDQSVRCQCLTCNHPPVAPDRHHQEPAQRLASYERVTRGTH